MSRKWVEDINYNILNDGEHWTIDPPVRHSDPRFAEHQQSYLTLSNNTLMNLFQNPFVRDEKITFRVYYNSPITYIVQKFIEALDRVPQATNTSYPDEKRAFSNTEIMQAKGHLRGALSAAQQYAEDATMKDLYLDSFYSNTSLRDRVIPHFRDFQQGLRWICVPFLALPMDSPGFRPNNDDLELHLEGGSYNGIELAGIGDLDFHGVLFKHHRTRIAADRHGYAMKFAMCRGFFDDESVWDRVVREADGRPRDIRDGSCDFSDRYDMKGGGNGYRCDDSSGQRKCVVAQPQYYCVNNGSQFC